MQYNFEKNLRKKHIYTVKVPTLYNVKVPNFCTGKESKKPGRSMINLDTFMWSGQGPIHYHTSTPGNTNI
jgi:hypothetical protein